MDIPIRNIYFLLSYAWKHFKFNDIQKIDSKNISNSVEFFGELFDTVLNRYLKRGIKCDYVELSQDLKTIKSKINFARTIKKSGFKSKIYNCSYDNYTFNNLTNQIIKQTALKLIKSDINIETKKSIKKKLIFLSNVDFIELDKNTLGKIKFYRDNNNLNFLLNICKYIFNNIGFQEKTGKYLMSDFLKSKNMPTIFESFILNFYKAKLKEKTVNGGKYIKWDSETENQLYPVMKTDITIEDSNRFLIIDTKYYSDIFQYNYEVPKFKSNNIYQIYTYINNANISNTEGMLLYPTTHINLTNERIISGKKILINTINLNQDWEKIESDLIEIVN